MDQKEIEKLIFVVEKLSKFEGHCNSLVNIDKQLKDSWSAEVFKNSYIEVLYNSMTNDYFMITTENLQISPNILETINQLAKILY